MGNVLANHMFYLTELGIERGILMVVLRVVLATMPRRDDLIPNKCKLSAAARAESSDAGHPLNGEHCANGRVIGARSHARAVNRNLT